ncbi:MAG TPA: hypothetical protein VFN42_11815 [Acetobacteraceae bacterium]|nr:hypothetical protein [Acetobacteraceae bacterium]
MRHPLPLLLLLLAGCQASPLTLTTVVGGVTVGSVAVLHRSPFDAAWSLLTGRDCSVVRLDQGKTWCRMPEPPPDPPPYCTRSLGTVDCWADPAGKPPEVADGPRSLTPAQEADRIRSWPF